MKPGGDRRACPERTWLARLCRLIPTATAAAALLAVALGYPLPVLSAAGLLLLCVAVCLVLWLQSRESERQIETAVEEWRSQRIDRAYSEKQ